MDMVDKSDQATIPVKDRVEFLTKVYDRMAGLTANADTKAGIILAIHSFWAISYGPNLSKLIISFPTQPVKLATVASLMRTVAAMRNAAEYDSKILLPLESAAVRAAWNAIEEWAQSQKIEP